MPDHDHGQNPINLPISMSPKILFGSILLFIGISSSKAQTDVIDNAKYNEAVEFYNRGKIDYDSKQFQSAIENFRRAFLLNPTHSDYPFDLSISYYEIKKYDSALKYIELAIALEPNQPDYHYRAGNIFFHKKDYSNAVHNYNITLANLNDEHPINIQNCYYNKAVSEYNLGNYTSTISDLTKLIKEDSTDFTYLHLRGVSYLRTKKVREGCVDLLKAYKLGNSKSEEYLGRYCP